MLLLLFFELTLFFLSNVAALSITVQPDTIVGQPSLVLWTREPSDGNGQLVFDLRFVKPDNEDVGLAFAIIRAQPSSEFGTVQVVFPSPGSYLLVAVSGPGYTKIGQSGQVNAFQIPITSLVIPTSTSKPTPSATTSSSATPTSTSSSASSATAASRKKDVGAIVGGTLGGVAFLGLLAGLGIFFLRRRRPTENKKRWTFHRDKMILPPVLDIRRISPMNTEYISPEDIEQQGELPHDDLPTSPIVIMTSRSGLGPSLKSPHRPLPLPPPVPLKPHQEDIVEHTKQLRHKMTELAKNPGPTQHIILDDLQKQMNWLESQMKKENLRS